jgi:hypothetical protein
MELEELERGGTSSSDEEELTKISPDELVLVLTVVPELMS